MGGDAKALKARLEEAKGIQRIRGDPADVTGLVGLRAGEATREDIFIEKRHELLN